jgi:hypothetical protein
MEASINPEFLKYKFLYDTLFSLIFYVPSDSKKIPFTLLLSSKLKQFKKPKHIYFSSIWMFFKSIEIDYENNSGRGIL